MTYSAWPVREERKARRNFLRPIVVCSTDGALEEKMVLSCQQVEEWIEKAMEGLLDTRQERALIRHLEECPRCRRRYEREKCAVEALRLLPLEEPPAGLPERVLAALPTISPRLLTRLADALRRAAVEPDFRRRLQENPQAALLSMHIALPPGLRVEVVPGPSAPLPTPEVLYLPLPESPLAIEEMEQRLAAMGLGALFGFWW